VDSAVAGSVGTLGRVAGTVGTGQRGYGRMEQPNDGQEMQEAVVADPHAEEYGKLEKAFRGGASWFYWIAALSLVNSVVHLFDVDRSFVIGLGITQVFEAITLVIAEETGAEFGMVLKGLSLCFTLFVAALFAFFGYMAIKRHHWAFIVGMILYLLDGLLFLIGFDILSLGFHGLALFFMFGGYNALKKLESMEQC